MPGSPSAFQGEKNWRELERLGITVKVDPKENNTLTSALVLANKPDGSLRVCGDYRLLNERTVLDGFPLPNLRHFMAKIKGSTIFSRVDLVKAFHQIPLDPESKKKHCGYTLGGVAIQASAHGAEEQRPILPAIDDPYPW